MRSKKIEFRLPWLLVELLTERRKQLRMRSIGRYFISLAVEDLMRERRAETYRAIANAEPEEQDEFLAWINAYPSDRQSILKLIIASMNAQKPK